MKPLDTGRIAYYELFIGGKDKWLKAWQQMRDMKDWSNDWR